MLLLTPAPAVPAPGGTSGLQFDVYSAASPNGALLTTLTDAREKMCAISLDGAGSGTFSLPRSSAQATTGIIAQGNLVKVRLTEVSTNPIFSFWMETGRFDLIGSSESGSEMLTFGGSGARSYLGRAIMWSQSFVAGEDDPVLGEWLLYNGLNGPKAGAILRRLIAESIAVGRPQQPLPSLSFDFTYTLDSAGATWSSTPASGEFIAHVGDSLDAVVAALQSAVPSLVIQVDANLGLHAYNSFGVDRHSATFAAGKVRLEKGVNIATALTRELGASRIKSHMLVAGDPGFYGTAANALTPVREGFASSAGIDTAALDALASGQLSLRSANADSIRVGVPYGNTPTTTGTYYPGPVGTAGHFWVGDSITVHTGTSAHDYNESTQRIAEIAIGETEAGDVVVEVALGSTYSGADFARIHDVITEQRTDVQQLSNEALRYAHSLRSPKVVTSLPVLPDPTFPLGTVVFLTTDAKLYRNADGSTWTRAVDGADVVAGTILAGALAVGSVTAEALAATIVLGSLLETADSGRRVEMDVNGIRLYDGTEGLLVKIPTDGSPVYISAEVVASSLSVLGASQFRGTSHFGLDSVTTLDAGVQAPNAAPALVKGWQSHTPAAPTPPSAGYTFGGISTGKYDAAGGASGATPCFIAVVSWSKAANPDIVEIIEWKIADWSVDRRTTLTGLTKGVDWAVYASGMGVTRLGTSWFIGAQDVSANSTTRVTKITRSTGAQSATATRVMGAGLTPFWDITNDGTNLLLVLYDFTPTLKVETWTTTPAFSATKTITSLAPANANGIAGIEYDGTNWWIAFGIFTGGVFSGRAYMVTPATGVGVANHDFPFPNDGDYTSLYWDGTVFHSGSGSSSAGDFRINDHTSWDWTTASPLYWVGYSWYDDVGATHETPVGPRASITMERRQQLSVTTQPIPTGGVDDPSKVNVYMAPGATDPGPGALHLQASDALTARTLTTYDGASVLDDTLTPFDGQVGATLQSAVGWRVRGNGLQSFGGGTFPTAPEVNDQWYRTDLASWFSSDGDFWYSTPQSQLQIPAQRASLPLTATLTSSHIAAVPNLNGASDLWLVRHDVVYLVASGGTALSGSHKWVGTLSAGRLGSATQDALATITIASGASAVWRTDGGLLAALLDAGTPHASFTVTWTKTGTPGDLYVTHILTYRFVMPVTPGGGPAAPVLSNIVATPSTTSATIAWDVTPNATGQVEYGTTPSYGLTSTLETNFLASHSQAIASLTPGTTYHYRIHSVDALGNGVFSTDATFATSAGSVATVYGPAFALDTKNDCRVGADASAMSYRFKAGSSSTTSGVVWERRFGSGYAAGSGGTLRIGIQADDGTSNHFPSGTYLGSTDYTPGTISPAGNKGMYTALPAISLVAGTLYHLVFTNVAASPGSNYFSVNNAYTFNTNSPRQPAFSNTDFAVLYKNGTWSERTRDTPDFDLVMADASHNGSRFIASNHDAGTFGTINGTNNKVRERFTPTSTITVTKAWYRLSRTSGTTGNLTFRLENSAGTLIEQGSVVGSGCPVWSSGSDSQTGAWLSYTFGTPRTLTAGNEYRLVISAGASDTYYSVIMLTQDSNDDPAHHMASRGFTDGVTEKTTTGGVPWSAVYGGFPNNGQFYFDLQ